MREPTWQTKDAVALRAPFPWFGGKSKVSPLVWSRFGDTPNYVEPFAGSLATVLGRPHWPFESHRIETVNDADCYLANFWRALQADPQAVADWTDWPVNEADLHARHLWLVNVARSTVEKLRTDPDFYDVKIAGWWVWGICQWIGSGWCHHPEWEKRPHLGDAGMGIHRPSQQLPHLGDAGMGIHRPSQKLPHLGDAGMGIHRPSQKRPHLGDAGRGIHRPSQQLPHLGNAGRGIHRPSQQLPHLGNAGMGIHRPSQQLPHLGNAGMGELHEYFYALAARLRGVRVCCGDWRRICGPTPTVKQGITAVFLDPPYAEEADRKDGLYAVDSLTIAHDVRKWAIENGGDKRMRIALCGYEGEHEMPADWECVAWHTAGGYSSQGSKVDINRFKERIWFSPHCLSANDYPLFAAADKMREAEGGASASLNSQQPAKEVADV